MARTAAANKRSLETIAKKSKKRTTDGAAAVRKTPNDDKQRKKNKKDNNNTKTSLKKIKNPKASRKKAIPHKNARMSNFKTSLRKKIQKAPEKQKKPLKTKQKAKESSNKAIVEKQPTNSSDKGKSLKKQITTTFTLISSQVSISIQQNKTPEAPAKKNKNDTDLKHIMDSIERVVSNNNSSDEKKSVKKANSKNRQRHRSPQRKRLASLNALAKVHCLYESDFRPRKRASDTESSDDDESSSSSSRSSSRQRAPVKKPPVKKKAAKKPVKKRSSMEVSTVDLSELVTPKRMASLNAAAILAASSQHWSDRPRKKHQIDTESDSDREKKAVESTDDDVPLVKIKKQKKNEKQITSSITSVRMIVQQQVEEGKTTTKSTFQATESSSEGTKSFQQHITCLKVSPTEDPGYAEDQQEAGAGQKAIGPGSYSPLGALYNMRPPNANAAGDAHEASGASADVAPGQSSPAPRGAVHVKERDKMWPPSADRLSGSSMPSVNFGGVPFMVNSHHPVQSVESYAGSARFAPSFSLYRPPIDIPYASLYPPAYPAPGAHFPPYYRGFALLPPPAPGFVPVALADSYSAYALAGAPSADLSYFLHRYPPAPPPCGSLPRYLPTPCTLVDWRTEGNRPVAEPQIMHDDRNLLPLAGTEAATTTTSANNSTSTTSSSSVAPKLEQAMPTRSYCPIDVPVGSALVPPVAAPSTRCLPGSCSCTAGQSTLQCPKNALAGPLTGEGKRSEPKSTSQSVIPHPSLDEPTSGSDSPNVPCLPPDLPCHGATESAAAVVDDQTITTEVEHNNNNNNSNGQRQKRRLANAKPPVSTRLRRRFGSTNDSDCTKDYCTEENKDEKPKKKPRKSEEKKAKPLKKFTNTTDVEDVDSLKVKESKLGRSKSRSPVAPPLSTSPNPRWSNGWSWLGSSYNSLTYLTNDDTPVMRRCYKAMKHKEGDVIQTRDCILLKSGTKAKDLPYIAKVSALWENADDGEMMMSLLWYYRPEHTDGGRKSCDLDDEIFASRHRDVCSVACIEDKCYVLTFNEYCRYRKQSKLLEGFTNPMPPPSESLSDYPRRARLPPACTPPDRVFLCRKVYDFRQKRILKNPV